MTARPRTEPTAALDLDVQRLTALQQLSSPALPIGSFSYSEGLESAVELGLVHDEASTGDWLDAHLYTVVADGDAPLWCLLYRAWTGRDRAALKRWNDWFHASRETEELRQETVQMGESLVRLTQELAWGHDADRQQLLEVQPATLPLAHSFACAAWSIPEEAGLAAYLFAWMEGQVTAAIKSVPIGQVAAQRILTHLRQQLPAVLPEARRRSLAKPPDLQTLAPQYSIVSARHESQFSRLFRS